MGVGGGRKMQVDRYASNVTAKIFEFMFIFKKICTYGANNGRGWWECGQAASRDERERERELERETDREIERERDGEGGGARCVRCLENAELSLHILLFSYKS